MQRYPSVKTKYPSSYPSKKTDSKVGLRESVQLLVSSVRSLQDSDVKLSARFGSKSPLKQAIDQLSKFSQRTGVRITLGNKTKSSEEKDVNILAKLPHDAIYEIASFLKKSKDFINLHILSKEQWGLIKSEMGVNKGENVLFIAYWEPPDDVVLNFVVRLKISPKIRWRKAVYPKREGVKVDPRSDVIGHIVSKCPNLKYLDVSDIKLRLSTVLKNIRYPEVKEYVRNVHPPLETLVADRCNFKRLDGVEKLKNLKALSVERNILLSNIKAISGLDNLLFINLLHWGDWKLYDHITTPVFPKSLKTLLISSLFSSGFSENIAKLSLKQFGVSLPNLTSLRISRINCNKAIGFEYLKNLKVLDLRENSIPVLESINELNQLLYLNLHGNRFQAPIKFGDLHKLLMFKFSSEQDYPQQAHVQSWINKLRDIMYLDLQGSIVGAIKSLAHLKQLKVLELPTFKVSPDMVIEEFGDLQLEYLSIPDELLSRTLGILYRNKATVEKLEISGGYISDLGEVMKAINKYDNISYMFFKTQKAISLFKKGEQMKVIPIKDATEFVEYHSKYLKLVEGKCKKCYPPVTSYIKEHDEDIQKEGYSKRHDIEKAEREQRQSEEFSRKVKRVEGIRRKERKELGDHFALLDFMLSTKEDLDSLSAYKKIQFKEAMADLGEQYKRMPGGDEIIKYVIRKRNKMKEREQWWFNMFDRKQRMDDMGTKERAEFVKQWNKTVKEFDYDKELRKEFYRAREEWKRRLNEKMEKRETSKRFREKYGI